MRASVAGVAAALLCCCALTLGAARPARAATDGGAGASALPATLPFRRDPPPRTDVTGLAGAGAAVLLLAVAGALAWRQRRARADGAASAPWLDWMGRRQGDEAIKLVDSKQLGPGNRLQVVEWEGCRYLLSSSQHGVAVVDRRATPGAAAHTPAMDAE